MDTRSPEQRSRIMASVGQKNTGAELAVRRMLFAAGFRFRLHRKELPGSPDIVLPSRRAAVFVHGCFWHGHDCSKGHLPKSKLEYWKPKIARNRERDAEHIRALRRLEWRCLVVWECELKSPQRLAEKLNRFLATESAASKRRTSKNVTTNQTDCD